MEGVACGATGVGGAAAGADPKSGLAIILPKDGVVLVFAPKAPKGFVLPSLIGDLSGDLNPSASLFSDASVPKLDRSKLEPKGLPPKEGTLVPDPKVVPDPKAAGAVGVFGSSGSGDLRPKAPGAPKANPVLGSEEAPKVKGLVGEVVAPKVFAWPKVDGVAAWPKVDGVAAWLKVDGVAAWPKVDGVAA